MLTRRQFLVGGGAGAGAVVVLGGAGLVAIGGPRRQRLEHRLGLTESPDHAVAPSGTPVISGTLHSIHMPAPVGWSVSVPAGALDGVVYCLHGHGNDHHFAFDEIHLPDVAAAAGARLAIAAVDGGAGSYWHPRADGSDAQAMLLDEFIPLVEQRVPAAAGRPRALLGWSMGGYGSLLAAETVPERFRAVAVGSPALWTSPGATAPGAFDDAADFRLHDVFAHTERLASMAVRVDCGTSDPFLAADRAFVARMSPAPEGGFTPGFHDAMFWRSVAPDQIAGINRALTRS